MSQPMEISYAALDQAADDVNKTGGELKALFDDLKSQLNPLISSWEGDGQAAYLAAQAEWDKGFDELNQLLAQIGGVLPQLREAYQSTEQGVTNLF